MPPAPQTAQQEPINKSSSDSSSTIWMVISLVLAVCLVTVSFVSVRRGVFKAEIAKPVGNLKTEFNIQTIDDLAAIDEPSFEAHMDAWWEKNQRARLNALAHNIEQEYDNLPELKSIPNEGVIEDLQIEMEKKAEAMGKEILEVHLPKVMMKTETTFTDVTEVAIFQKMDLE